MNGYNAVRSTKMHACNGVKIMIMPGCNVLKSMTSVITDIRGYTCGARMTHLALVHTVAVSQSAIVSILYSEHSL